MNQKTTIEHVKAAAKKAIGEVDHRDASGGLLAWLEWADLFSSGRCDSSGLAQNAAMDANNHEKESTIAWAAYFALENDLDQAEFELRQMCVS